MHAMSNWKILFCTLTFAFDFIPFFITQLFNKFEKHAELNENWANNLPLKYDDHACIERNEIVFFAQHLSLSFATLSRAKSRYEGFIRNSLSR